MAGLRGLGTRLAPVRARLRHWFGFGTRRGVANATVAVSLLCALLSLLRGQDANWDLRNYHVYNAWALLEGRLGIDLVLIRNDVDAQATRSLDPAEMDRLRLDPGLVRLATFGGDRDDDGAATATSGATGAAASARRRWISMASMWTAKECRSVCGVISR